MLTRSLREQERGIPTDLGALKETILEDDGDSSAKGWRSE